MIDALVRGRAPLVERQGAWLQQREARRQAAADVVWRERDARAKVRAKHAPNPFALPEAATRRRGGGGEDDLDTYERNMRWQQLRDERRAAEAAAEVAAAEAAAERAPPPEPRRRGGGGAEPGYATPTAAWRHTGCARLAASGLGRANPLQRVVAGGALDFEADFHDAEAAGADDGWEEDDPPPEWAAPDRVREAWAAEDPPGWAAPEAIRQ